MALRFDTPGQKLFGVSPYSAFPLAIFAWVKKSTTTFTYACTVTNSDAQELRALALDGGGKVRATSRDNGDFRQATTVASYGTDVWIPCIAEFPDADNRAVEFNGGNRAIDESFSNPTGLTEVTIGWRNGDDPSSLEADLAEVAILDFLPDDDVKAQLASGVSPAIFGPPFYQPLTEGSDLTAPEVGNSMTVIGPGDPANLPELISDHPAISSGGSAAGAYMLTFGLGVGP